MFITIKRYGSKSLTSVLDAGKLNDNGEDDDNNEKRVIEEIREHVKFSFLQFPSIYFVEHLHQHESVEENAIMFSSLIVPFCDSDRGLDIEQLRT